jgi:uncharacterized protein (DUF1697 family)
LLGKSRSGWIALVPTHAAFLRAVNLGGRRRASSEALRATFEEIELGNAQTFRASGNVVFDAARTAEAQLREAIERALAERLGFSVSVYLRSAAQLRALTTDEPFHAARTARAKLQVALLERPPSAREREQVLAHATNEDLLSFGRRELLWLPSSGTQRSNLNLRAIEKLIGPWTMRTMETIEEIVSRHFA